MCERLIVISHPFRPQSEGWGQLRKSNGLLRVLLRVLLPPAQELANLMEEEEAGSVRGVEIPLVKE